MSRLWNNKPVLVKYLEIADRSGKLVSEWREGWL